MGVDKLDQSFTGLEWSLDQCFAAQFKFRPSYEIMPKAMQYRHAARDRINKSAGL